MKQQWKWTVQKDIAARFVAHGELTDAAIARKVRIGRTTLHRWKLTAEFQTRVEEHAGQVGETLAKLAAEACRAIATKRLALMERLDKIVEDIPEEKLLRIQDSPISAIHLLLRLYSTVEAYEKKRSEPTAPYEDIDWPTNWEVEPEVGRKIMAILQQENEGADHAATASHAYLSGIREEDD